MDTTSVLCGVSGPGCGCGCAVLGPTGFGRWRRVTSEMDALSDARRKASVKIAEESSLLGFCYDAARLWLAESESGCQIPPWSQLAPDLSAGTSCATCEGVRAVLLHSRSTL